MLNIEVSEKGVGVRKNKVSVAVSKGLVSDFEETMAENGHSSRSFVSLEIGTVNPGKNILPNKSP